MGGSRFWFVGVEKENTVATLKDLVDRGAGGRLLSHAKPRRAGGQRVEGRRWELDSSQYAMGLLASK